MPIREEAFPFAAPLAVAAAVAGVAGLSPFLQGILWAAVLCVCAFFRDPNRQPPEDDRLLVSPADGRIIHVGREGDRWKISVFMSVFNVHVNRAPAQGAVEKTAYTPGKYLAAWNEKASLDNERLRIQLRTERGSMDVVLIAGLIARRIVCWAVPDRRVARGERIGLIRFGSRVDIFLPASEAEPLVALKDRVSAGRTPVARWKDTAP